MLAGMDAPADQQRAGQLAGARPGRRSSGLATWVAQARRDARVLLDGLRGRHPAPLVPRRPRGHAERQTPHAGVAGRDVFEERGVDGDALAERVGQPYLPEEAPARGTAETVHVHILDRSYEIRVRPGETILDAALAAGLPMPFSCTMGGCGACKVRRRGGIVAMDEPSCLTPAERAAGHVLTCVGRPVGTVSIEVALP
jgi:ferredoxin